MNRDRNKNIKEKRPIELFKRDILYNKGELKMFSVSDLIMVVGMLMASISLFIFGAGKQQPKWFTYLEVPVITLALFLGMFINDMPY